MKLQAVSYYGYFMRLHSHKTAIDPSVIECIQNYVQPLSLGNMPVQCQVITQTNHNLLYWEEEALQLNFDYNWNILM